MAPALGPIALVEGDPRVPVLSLHDLGDLFVPFSMEQYYAADVAANGQSDLLVQRAIRARRPLRVLADRGDARRSTSSSTGSRTECDPLAIP